MGDELFPEEDILPKMMADLVVCGERPKSLLRVQSVRRSDDDDKPRIVSPNSAPVITGQKVGDGGKVVEKMEEEEEEEGGGERKEREDVFGHHDFLDVEEETADMFNQLIDMVHVLGLSYRYQFSRTLKMVMSSFYQALVAKLRALRPAKVPGKRGATAQESASLSISSPITVMGGDEARRDGVAVEDVMRIVRETLRAVTVDIVRQLTASNGEGGGEAEAVPPPQVSESYASIVALTDDLRASLGERERLLQEREEALEAREAELRGFAEETGPAAAAVAATAGAKPAAPEPSSAEVLSPAIKSPRARHTVMSIARRRSSSSEDEAPDSVVHRRRTMGKQRELDEGWGEKRLQNRSASSSRLVASYDAVLASKPTWVPDNLVSHCLRCGSPFSFSRRRHHCRNCGNIFCSSCTPHRVPLPMYGYERRVRVCVQCEGVLCRTVDPK